MGDVLTPEEREFFESEMKAYREVGGLSLAPVVDRLVSEVERLRAASKAAFACIECDGEVKADEDGCCSNCGSDCFVLIGSPEEREILRHDISARFEAEVERLRARNEALEKVAKAARKVDEWSFSEAAQTCEECGSLPPNWEALGRDAAALTIALSALAEPGKGGATSERQRGVAGDRCEAGNNCGRPGCPECQA